MKYTFIIVTLISIAFLAISIVGVRMSYGQANLVSHKDPMLMPYNLKELSLAGPPQKTKQILDGVLLPYSQLPKIVNVRGNPSDSITGKIGTRPLPGGNLVLLGPTKPRSPVYIISTIGTSTYYPYVGDFSKLYLSCPDEVAILIHGWNPNPLSKVKDFNRASMSIESNHYNIPTIGVMWSSDHPIDSKDFSAAVLGATKTGPKLAQFLVDFKNHCNDTVLRIVAHSLGSTVVDSMLTSLDSNEKWKSSGYEIGTIQFLGAAISSRMPDIHANGAFIQKYVGTFYNLYSSADHLLKVLNDRYGLPTLGLTGAALGIVKPTNYKDTDVTNEIPANNDADGDGVCDGPVCDLPLIEKGQNHLGYWGFVDTGGHFIDDGAMNVVVAEWKVGPFKVDKTREVKPLGPIREVKPLGPIH